MTEQTMQDLARLAVLLGEAHHFLDDSRLIIGHGTVGCLDREDVIRARNRLHQAGSLLDTIGERIEAGQS